MIHDIVSSDVDFARGMIDSSHSDAEILAYLASRGIEPAKAAHLVDDLRHGRHPSAQLPFVPPPGGHRAVGGPGFARAEAHHEHHAHRHHSHSGKHRRSVIPWWFVMLALIFLGALVYALLEAGTHVSKQGIDQDKHEIPPPPGKDR